MRLLTAILLVSQVFATLCAQDDSLEKQDAELLAFFKGLHKRAPVDCPERMAVNTIGETECVIARRILSGEMLATDEQKVAARKELVKRRDRIKQGQDWPLKERKGITIPYAAEKPEIGCDIDSGAWKRGFVFNSEFNLGSLEEIKASVEWRLLWDEDFLYVGVKAVDHDVKSIEYGKVQGQCPWDADCIEVFILPSMRMKTYWEVVVNPEGKIYDGLHSNNGLGWFVNRPEESISGLKTYAKTTPGGYLIQAAIPFKELPNYMLDNKPETGQTIYLSLVRIEDGQRRSPSPLLYDGHNIFGFLKATLGK